MSYERNQKKLAHAKQREEIRNAVHVALLQSGLSEELLGRAIEDLIRKKVVEQVEKIVPKLDDIIAKEVTGRIKGTIDVPSLKKAVAEQVTIRAQAFVNNAVKITMVDEDTW